MPQRQPQNAHPADGIYFGLMSGTSMDGVDGVAVRFEAGKAPVVLAEAFVGFAQSLRDALFALQQPGDDEIDRESLAANALVARYAVCCHELQRTAGLSRDEIRAIGVHGQTVRHRPERGYTRQINNPALLAELTQVDVIADFRSRDVAAGGHGAPLAPGFHATVFGAAGETRVVCNLGGISNITILPGEGGDVRGFDCGPANALLDEWATRHLGKPYDDGGKFAARGTVHAALLDALLDEPYFAAPPPKSTGRDLFNPAWLDAKLAAFSHVAPQDVQATLAALTAVSVAREIALACSGLQGRVRMRRRRTQSGAARCAPACAARGRRAGHGRYDSGTRRAASAGRGTRVRVARVPFHRAPARQSRDGYRCGRQPRARRALSALTRGRPRGERRMENGHKKRGMMPRFSFRRTGVDLSCAQTENDEPHPQVVVAFGFLITNWAPLRSSL